MCVGFWALDHPTWSLILCANRDEYLDRPTLPAAWHDFSSRRGARVPTATASVELTPRRTENSAIVLSGIDVQAGGTWIGINSAGRIALLYALAATTPPLHKKESSDRSINSSERRTNITEPTVSPHTISRGEYVASFLDPDDRSLLSSRANSLSEFLDLVVAKPSESPVDVGGFNLLLFEPKLDAEATPASAIFQTPSSDTLGLSPSSSELESVTFEAALLGNSGTQTAVRARALGSNTPGLGTVVCCVPGDRGGDRNHRVISFGGLSNAIDGREQDGLGLTDPWTKVTQGRSMLEDVLASYSDTDVSKYNDDKLEKEELQLVEDLMRLLGTLSPNNIETLRDFRENIFVPPIGMHRFRTYRATPTSAPEPDEKWYGTRLSTVILVRRTTGEVLFVERDRLRANSTNVQPKSSSGVSTGKGLVEGLDVTVSTPEILTPDEGRTTQRLFRFTIGR